MAYATVGGLAGFSLGVVLTLSTYATEMGRSSVVAISQYIRSAKSFSACCKHLMINSILNQSVKVGSDRPDIEIERVFELGVVLAARALWEELGIGPAFRRCAEQGGRPQPDAAKVKAAEKFDGKFVVISNDDTLSAKDIALGYKGGMDHRILLPASEADGSASAADVSLDAASDRGARQALCVGAADATGG
jgi:hypothetical protein